MPPGMPSRLNLTVSAAPPTVIVILPPTRFPTLWSLRASIRAGTVAPSVLMRRLAAYPRQNALARALREIGCLERTLFILDWISDPALRRRS